MADAEQLAAKIEKKAVDLLDPLKREMIVMNWPPEFRAIMWQAVAQTAASLAIESKQEGRR